MSTTADSGSLGDPLQGNSRDVEGKTVTLTHTTIAGLPADCYTIPQDPAGAKPRVFCLSKENVPLRIDGGDGKPVDATSLDHGLRVAFARFDQERFCDLGNEG